MKNFIEIPNIKSVVKRFDGIMKYSKNDVGITSSLIITFNEYGSSITAINKEKRSSLTLITDRDSHNGFKDKLVVPIKYLKKLNGDYIASYEENASELIFEPLNRSGKKNDRRPKAKVNLLNNEIAPENLKTSIPEDFHEKHTITDEMARIINKAVILTEDGSTLFSNVSINTDIVSTDSKRILFAKDCGLESEYVLQLSKNMINQINEGCKNLIVTNHSERYFYSNDWIYFEDLFTSRFPDAKSIVNGAKNDSIGFIKMNDEFVNTLKEAKKYLKSESLKVSIITKSKMDKVILNGLDENDIEYNFECDCEVLCEDTLLPLNIKLFTEMLSLIDNNNQTINIKLDNNGIVKAGVTITDGNIDYVIMPLRVAR